ncbi:hypothetical protein [Parasediminibacterium sp. JCM 36343]|uniref:hypothetical protein n=1 Tax=Parasediminibacterium sp. JCM 36343 TaxID=3374279 RepID=UPI003978F1F5
MRKDNDKKIVFTTSKKLSRKAAECYVRVIATLLPRRYWYKSAYKSAFLLAGLSRKVILKKAKINYYAAQRLNAFLGLFTAKGKEFYIPTRIKGAEYLNSQKEGLVICTVHLPLVKVGFAAILKEGYEIHGAIAHKQIKDRLMQFWGCTQTAPTILADNTALLKTRAILKRKGTVIVMIDALLGMAFSPNMLRLAGKMEVKVLFLIAKLSPDGVIDAEFLQPPYPICDTEDKIKENLDFLRKQVNDTMAAYS